jgi:hypothetical protein
VLFESWPHVLIFTLRVIANGYFPWGLSLADAREAVLFLIPRGKWRGNY